MKLAQVITLSRIAAGGPGSGRHPGNGASSVEQGRMVNHLRKFGFKHLGDGVYRHPQHGVVKVHPSGAWNHMPAYKQNRSYTENSLSSRVGIGLGSLQRRF